MKKYTLRWVKNVDEFEKRTASETNEILKDLNRTETKAKSQAKTGLGILKASGIAAIPLLIAGLVQLEVGSIIDNNGVMFTGISTLTTGGLGALAGMIACHAMDSHADRVKHLINRKKEIIKEIAEARGQHIVEEVEDEIQ